ncbi:hypothetical protein ACFRJ1_09315 [Streptomyces sp. NPDC056773]|uniref:hypothetical protein n=1 Tax=unclassified Streptomyces TaxID=2593676 RepID=UPI0036CA5FDD
MDRMRNTVNRLALLAGGCLFLAVGTAVLTAHTAARLRAPHWWTDFSSRARWLEPQAWAAGRAHPGWSTGVTAALVLTALTAAALILLQLRRRTLRRLPLGSPATSVEGRAVTGAVTARLLAMPGVHSGRSTLHGTPGSPHLRTRPVVDDTASPRQLLAALTASTVPEARGFLTARDLTAEVRFTVRGPRRRRSARVRPGEFPAQHR